MTNNSMILAAVFISIFSFLEFQPLTVFAQTDAPADALQPANAPKPTTDFGNFEVGLPGGGLFRKGQPVSGVLAAKGSQGTPAPVLTLVGMFVQFLIALIVIIGVITMVIGGYFYMTAGGNAHQVEQAKEMIYSSLIGIFIAFISVVILNTINPFLGSKAVEPKLKSPAPSTSSEDIINLPGSATNTSGTSGGGSSTNNSSSNTNASQIADLQAQEQAVNNDISTLESQIPPGGTASAQLQDQINQDEARLQDLINQVRALQNNTQTSP